MNKTDTQIISFQDINNAVFTLKLGKSYNIAKSEKFSFFNLKTKYCIKITNCVTVDTFTLEYFNRVLRDTEYQDFVNTYKSFNDME